MTDLNLKELGRAVSDEFPETTMHELLQEQESFLSAVETQRPNRSLRYGLMAVAAVLLIGIGSVAYFQLDTTNVDQPALEQAPLAIVHEVIKRDSGQEVIKFDGGSRFELGNGTNAKVINSSQKEVVVDLEAGSVRCSINGNGHTRWIVRAGEHQVLVTGTKFVVNWDPAVPALKVDVSEGSVLVMGNSLNADGIRLAAGEDMLMDENGVSISDKTIGTDSKAHSPEVIVAPTEPEPAQKATSSTRKSSQKATSGKSGPAAASVARKRTYEELWKLGSQARYQGNYDEAFNHFLALQSKFPGKPYTKQATFLLGRISQEQRNQPLEAKKWFEKYLRISPSGALAEQSVGRLIQICRNAGKPCSKVYASWYQRHFPEGAFAELAQSVLE